MLLSAFSLHLVYVVLVLALWLYWRRCRNWNQRLKNFPSAGKFAFPLVGHLHQILGAHRGYLDKFLEIGVRCGGIQTLKPTCMWIGEFPIIAVFSPKDIEVLLGSTKELLKPDIVYKAVRAFFGDGLITLNGASWQHHRKVLTPTFHFKILERYVEVFRRHADVLVKELREPNLTGVEVNAMPLMARVVSSTICETAFGMSERLSQRDEVKKTQTFFEAFDVSFRTVRARLLKPWLTVDALYQFSSVCHEQNKAEAVIRDYATRIIKMKKEEIAQDGPSDFSIEDDDIGEKKKVAFLDLVLRDAKNLLSEEEILNEVRTLVTVQQTTASTLSFVYVMLAIFQDIQEKVYREILDIDKNSGGTSYYEQLGQMKYLERVIKETMRLYPVTALFSRVLKEDLVVPSGTLPAGILCFVIPYVTHRDKDIFGPDPESFDPDHFLPERCRTRHPYAYIPFSAGPRNCIGQKYAMLQMKAIVSTVVRNIRIFPGKGCHSQKDLHLDIDTFLHIVGGFNVRFEPRDEIQTL